MELFYDNIAYLLLGFAFFGAIFLLMGLFSGAGLVAKHRKKRVVQFVSVGLAVLAFAAPHFKPRVRSFTNVDLDDNIKVSELATNEQIATLEKEQAGQIEDLKTDILELQQDLYEINRYYSILFYLLSGAGFVFCLFFAFRKDKETVENISE